MYSSLIVPFLVSAAYAAPTEALAAHKSASQWPFKKMVAFGDSLTDNGNGSYAHCVQQAIGSQCENTIYGYRTWTDGPVAVMYLADMLSVPLTRDYAFGWALGGSKVAATIEQSYTPTLYSQSGQQQIHNYTHSDGYEKIIKDSLHFLWIGNNDINLDHISTSSSNNPTFASQMANMMVDLVDILTSEGAPYVFVPSLYAKQLGPNWQFYCSTQAERTNMGLAIQQANAAIKAALLNAHPKKVIWYDSYSRMEEIWNNAASYGITYVGSNFCDGYSQEDWNACVVDGKGSQFYWMQYTDMTTYVHQLIAQDMYSTIQAYFS